jgi:Tfp pilus assembly protein PilV
LLTLLWPAADADFDNLEKADPRFKDMEVLSMDGTTALLILIAGVVVIVIALGVSMMRRGRLRSLSSELKSRHAQSWTAIQARFLAEPAAAVQEADQLAVSILRDRGAKMDDDRRLPAELRRAREAAGTDEGQSGTEGLRKAMLHYQAIVDDAVGESMRKSPDIKSKEVAS